MLRVAARSYKSYQLNWKARGTSAVSYTFRSYADQAAAGQHSWMPHWLQSRLPGVLGGSREVEQLDNLTLDSYASSMKRARQMGSLTGYALQSSKISSPAVQGSFRLHESIIGHMKPEERTDLSLFGAAARRRVAADAACTSDQVDDCIAKYEWMAHMTKQMAALKRAGKPLPQSVEEMEGMLGNWRSHKLQQVSSSPSGGHAVAYTAKGPRNQPCGLAGQSVGRNTKCPVTRKAFKACCGRQISNT